MQPGHAEQRTHDYVRHGTATLFAALEIATGKVTGVCKNRHRHQEFLAFLRHLARAYPDRGDGIEIHLVMDNYATHKRPEIRAWLDANPRFHAHFTSTSGQDRGSTWWRSGSASSNAKPSAAAASGQYPPSSPRSEPSSPAGTHALTRSSGPRHQTTSSTPSTGNVNMFQRQATSAAGSSGARSLAANGYSQGNHRGQPPTGCSTWWGLSSCR